MYFSTVRQDSPREYPASVSATSQVSAPISV